MVSIYAGTSGLLDDIPVDDVRRFESELIEYVRTRHGDLLEGIKSSGNLPDDEDALKNIVTAFSDQFQPTEAPSEDGDKTGKDKGGEQAKGADKGGDQDKGADKAEDADKGGDKGDEQAKASDNGADKGGDQAKAADKGGDQAKGG